MEPLEQLTTHTDIAVSVLSTMLLLVIGALIVIYRARERDRREYMDSMNKHRETFEAMRQMLDKQP